MPSSEEAGMPPAAERMSFHRPAAACFTWLAYTLLLFDSVRDFRFVVIAYFFLLYSLVE